jgi:hypothetical protein
MPTYRVQNRWVKADCPSQAAVRYAVWADKTPLWVPIEGVDYIVARCRAHHEKFPEKYEIHTYKGVRYAVRELEPKA